MNQAGFDSFCWNQGKEIHQSKSSVGEIQWMDFICLVSLKMRKIIIDFFILSNLRFLKEISRPKLIFLECTQ